MHCLRLAEAEGLFSRTESDWRLSLRVGYFVRTGPLAGIAGSCPYEIAHATHSLTHSLSASKKRVIICGDKCGTDLFFFLSSSCSISLGMLAT